VPLTFKFPAILNNRIYLKALENIALNNLQNKLICRKKNTLEHWHQNGISKIALWRWLATTSQAG
jgi:hypothetical protein